MNYATKVREVRAVRYNGHNKEDVKELIRDMPDGIVCSKENGRLLLRFGLIDVGDWVVIEEGLVKIFSDAQFHELYEAQDGEDLWSLFIDLYNVIAPEVERFGERKSCHHMYDEYITAKEYIERVG